MIREIAIKISLAIYENKNYSNKLMVILYSLTLRPHVMKLCRLT